MNTTYKVNSTVGQLGDFAKEWWTDEDHARWEQKVEDWTKTGELDTPFSIEMTLIDNPMMDNRSYHVAPFISCRFGFMDFSK